MYQVDFLVLYYILVSGGYVFKSLIIQKNMSSKDIREFQSFKSLVDIKRHPTYNFHWESSNILSKLVINRSVLGDGSNCIIISITYFPVFRSIYSALRDLVPCAQFQKREKHPWVFFTFFKLYEWY